MSWTAAGLIIYAVGVAWTTMFVLVVKEPENWTDFYGAVLFGLGWPVIMPALLLYRLWQ